MRTHSLTLALLVGLVSLSISPISLAHNHNGYPDSQGYRDLNRIEHKKKVREVEGDAQLGEEVIDDLPTSIPHISF